MLGYLDIGLYIENAYEQTKVHFTLDWEICDNYFILVEGFNNNFILCHNFFEL